MIHDFSGKVAMVTGASQGIGFACAEHFIRGGANVAIAARTPENIASAIKALEEVAQQGGKGNTVLGVTVDLSTAEGSQAFVQQTVDRFGGVDVMVNSAGGSRSAHFLEMPDQYLIDGWTLKLLGGIRMTRTVVPEMEKRGGGAIVLLSGASSGTSPQRLPALTTNAAQKSWVGGVAEDLAKRNISINLVQPGLVQTRRYTIEIERRANEAGTSLDEMLQKHLTTVPTGHITQPEETAELIAFLCARRVINLTGHEINCAY